MKKTIIFIFILLLGITLYNCLNQDNKYKLSESNFNEDQKEKSNKNFLTLMLEQDDGTYKISSSNTWPNDDYIFNENLSKCENDSQLTWDEETRKVILKANVSDKCYIYFDKKQNLTLAEYIITQVYTGIDGENNLYYHDGLGSYTNANQEAGDYSYRYAGANPNNYVCFGSDAATCPDDNLYRIIGVFNNQIKLIKADFANFDALGLDGFYIGSFEIKHESYKGNLSEIPHYYWNNNNNSNIWSESSINILNLNTNFLESLLNSSDYDLWEKIISSNTWYVNGYNTYNATPKMFFTSESTGTEWNGKIGLMYVSDYGYAANPDAWTTSVYNYNNQTIKSNNWLYIGANDWTISQNFLKSDNQSIFVIYFDGKVFDGYDPATFISVSVAGVRPCFYINPKIKYLSGNGSENNPYRIN